MRTKLSPSATGFSIAVLALFAGFSALALYGAGNSRASSARTISRPSSAQLTVATAKKSYGALPLAFEKNDGQSAAQVKYLAHGLGYEVFLTPQEAVVALDPPRKALLTSVSQLKDFVRAEKSQKIAAVRVQLKNGNAAPEIVGENQLARKTNYFTGSNPKNWHTNVPSYSAVQYKNVYPGVDLLFYGNNQRLEYDFQVAAGADPQQITLHLEGTRTLRTDAGGNLVLATADGPVDLLKPVAYQNVNGARKEIAANYRLGSNNDVTFVLGSYDTHRPLIIDPVLNYSTFLGGSPGGDAAFAVAVDASGDAFVTGETFSATFPTGTTVGLSHVDSNVNANGAAFVSEIDPTGTTELYFSYLSGDGGEVGGGIALDPVANTSCKNGAVPAVCVYVAGVTLSDDYPTSGTVAAYNATPPGGPGGGDAFLTKLNPNVAGSSSLVYSTYLASNGAGDFADGVAVDIHQHAFLTGQTFSTGGAVPNFPVKNAAQASNNDTTSGNSFLTVLDTTTGGTSGLVYSTFLGGSDDLAGGTPSPTVTGDLGQRVVVDASEIAYVAGVTISSNFPSIASTSTYPSIKGYSALPSGNTEGAGFVAAINTAGSGVNSLLYSTYLGGSSSTEPDNVYDIVLAGSGVVYVVGQTHSADFPVSQSSSTPGFPSPAASNAVPKAFVVKLDTTTTISPPPATPTYSVLIGGSSGELGRGIAIDTLGKVVIDGLTQSTDFPVTPGAFQSARAASAPGDAFVSKLDPTVTGSAGLLYSSYFGGSGSSNPDQAFDLALDTLGNAYLAGVANSGTNFPIFPSGAFESTFPVGATSAGFVAKLTLEPTVTVSPASLTFTGGVVGVTSAAQTVTLTNNTNSGVVMTSVTVVAGTPVASATDFATTNNTCTGTIAAGTSCTVGVTFTPSVTTTETATLTFTDSDTSSPQTVGLTGSGTVAASTTVTVLPTTLTFLSQTVNTASTAMTVTVTNTGNTSVTLGSPATSFSGTNASDFSLGSGTTCTASLVLTTSGAGSSCVIKVVFTPAASGAASATLSVADNATGNPQTVTLVGTGAVATNTVTVLPTTLTFSSQTVATASSPMTVTVTNTGNTPVTLGATVTAFSGTNASDFSVGSTTCTASLVLSTSGAGSTCTINVVFTPGAAGSRSATLSVTDTATGSPQTVMLSGTGTAAGTPDFSLTPSTQSVSVTRGVAGTFTVNVVGLNGFTSAVTLNCTGAPTNSSCSGPAPVSAAPSPGTAATFTIATKAFVPPASRNVPPVSPKQLVLLAAALSLLLLLPSTRRFRTRLGLAGAMAVLVIVAGCSSAPATPKGSYTLTVTGTSGSLSHSATVSLTVQ
jgi:Abnormal spindle-like microcephaly-assoc'd, ASPM-SPD-2-Hydin/Beta-propeller repeat